MVLVLWVMIVKVLVLLVLVSQSGHLHGKFFSSFIYFWFAWFFDSILKVMYYVDGQFNMYILKPNSYIFVGFGFLKVEEVKCMLNYVEFWMHILKTRYFVFVSFGF